MGNVGPAARLLGIGTYVALCIVLGTLGGRWLDGQLDTGNLLTVIGLCLGLVLAIYGGLQQLFETLRLINAKGKAGRDHP